VANDQNVEAPKKLLQSWLTWAEWLANTSMEMPASHAFVLCRLIAETRVRIAAAPASCHETGLPPFRAATPPVKRKTAAVIATEETILGWMLEHPAMAANIVEQWLAGEFAGIRERVRAENCLGLAQMIAPATGPDEGVQSPELDDEDEDDAPPDIGETLTYPIPPLVPTYILSGPTRPVCSDSFFGNTMHDLAAENPPAAAAADDEKINLCGPIPETRVNFGLTLGDPWTVELVGEKPAVEPPAADYVELESGRYRNTATGEITDGIAIKSGQTVTVHGKGVTIDAPVEKAANVVFSATGGSIGPFRFTAPDDPPPFDGAQGRPAGVDDEKAAMMRFFGGK
jgi:hypothetical protein